MKSLALVGLLVAVALAGCTDSGTVDEDKYEVPPMDENGNYVIEMGPGTNQLAFRPRYAEVPVGATVVWKNMGGSHNVVSGENGKDAGAWNAGPVNQEDFSITITEEMLGVQDYYCAPHWSLGMTGQLRVVEELDAMDGMDDESA